MAVNHSRLGWVTFLGDGTGVLNHSRLGGVVGWTGDHLRTQIRTMCAHKSGASARTGRIGWGVLGLMTFTSTSIHVSLCIYRYLHINVLCIYCIYTHIIQKILVYLHIHMCIFLHTLTFTCVS